MVVDPRHDHSFRVPRPDQSVTLGVPNACTKCHGDQSASWAAEQMKQANLDTNVILFSMWTEAIKNFAEYGKGNVIFLDGSSDGMQRTMQQIMGMVKAKE